jgi:hypothetical protein
MAAAPKSVQEIVIDRPMAKSVVPVANAAEVHVAVTIETPDENLDGTEAGDRFRIVRGASSTQCRPSWRRRCGGRRLATITGERVANAGWHCRTLYQTVSDYRLGRLNCDDRRPACPRW